jgi:hypothetical protein
MRRHRKRYTRTELIRNILGMLNLAPPRVGWYFTLEHLRVLAEYIARHELNGRVHKAGE